MNRKISGFSLIETMIAVSVFLIVISLTASAFHLFNNQFSKFKSSTDQKQEILSFYELLILDWENSSRIIEQNSNIISLEGGRFGSVDYIFDNSYICRACYSNIDSIKILNEIELGPMLRTNLISTLSIKVYVEKDTISFNLRKKYLSSEIFNMQ